MSLLRSIKVFAVLAASCYCNLFAEEDCSKIGDIEKIAQDTTLGEIELLDMVWGEGKEKEKCGFAGAKHGDIAVMKYAIGEGFDVNTFNGYFNPCSLVFAAKNKDGRMVKLLLENGINVDRQSNQVALYEAALNGDLEIIKMLAKAGMPLTLEDREHHHKTVTVKDVAKVNQAAIAKWYDEFTESKKEL